MTIGLHFATQLTCLLACTSTILTTTRLFNLWLVVPVFLTLQVGILVFLLITSSLPTVPSATIRMITLIAVQANSGFLNISAVQIANGLDISDWRLQVLITALTWTAVLSGVAMHAVDGRQLLPYLFGRTTCQNGESRKRASEFEEEEGRWINEVVVPSLTPIMRDKNTSAGPCSGGSSPYEKDTIKFASPTSFPTALYSSTKCNSSENLLENVSESPRKTR
ncbi:hypothetical protein MNV49_007287 [Pseudohyphozyma bogoriensis]|nr:hypothetical protein MNV49_007287 [Pseudohyphozyma bogoriensis]